MENLESQFNDLSNDELMQAYDRCINHTERRYTSVTSDCAYINERYQYMDEMLRRGMRPEMEDYTSKQLSEGILRLQVDTQDRIFRSILRISENYFEIKNEDVD